MDDCFISMSTAWLIACVAGIYFAIRWYLWRLTLGDYDQRYVLITGCDMGFGNLLAKRLISMGFNVFAGCLSEKGISDLLEVGSEKLTPFLLDVTKKEDIEKADLLVRELLPGDKGLWALVNNAGILGPLDFPDCFTRADYEKVLNVNMYGMIEMTTTFLPLIRQEEGRIVNVASVVGMVSLPVSIPYNISKYAVEAFSDGLRYSLCNQNVSVHMLEPGMHATNLFDGVSLENGISKHFHSAPQEVQDYYGEKCLKDHSWYVVKLVGMFTSTRLNSVIDAYVHAITAKFPKTRYLIGFDANFIFWPLKVMPDWFGDFLLRPRFCEPIGMQKKKSS